MDWWKERKRKSSLHSTKPTAPCVCELYRDRSATPMLKRKRTLKCVSRCCSNGSKNSTNVAKGLLLFWNQLGLASRLVTVGRISKPKKPVFDTHGCPVTRGDGKVVWVTEWNRWRCCGLRRSLRRLFVVRRVHLAGNRRTAHVETLWHTFRCNSYLHLLCSIHPLSHLMTHFPTV